MAFQKPSIELTDVEQIAALPWAGNAGDDRPLFELVKAYLDTQPEATQQRGYHLVSWHMMGEGPDPGGDNNPEEENR